MRKLFSPEELKNAELHPGFSFTKGCPVLKIPAGMGMSGSFPFGCKLFDLEADPKQLAPLDNDGEELRLIEAIRRFMLSNDAPDEQYERLGIPKDGAFAKADLLREREARAGYMKPDILDGYEFSDSLRCQLLACKRLPYVGPKGLSDFEEWVKANHAGERIETKHLMDFIQGSLSGAPLQMARYVLSLLGRTE
jgi:hypothetical protein